MKNRVIVITGATGVLGQLAAHTFAEGGASLALLSNDQDKLDTLARDLNLSDDHILELDFCLVGFKPRCALK